MSERIERPGRSERDIQNTILIAASKAGYTLWRNNVGTGWVGEHQRLRDGSVLVRSPRVLHAGLCKGSSDLIGIRPVVITEEMLGRTIAQFAAIEVKSNRGRARPEQDRFIAFVRSVGGYAVIARSAEDLA